MQPLKRQLPFSSMKPLFSVPGDYHRFASDSHRLTDNETDSIIVKAPTKTLGSAGASSTQPASTNPPATQPTSTSALPEDHIQAPPSQNVTSAPENANVFADTYGQAASNLVAGNSLEQTIQQLMDMGGGNWDRETVTRAL